MKCSTTYKTVLLLIVCLSFFSGCKNSKSVFENQSEIVGTPKVLFLNYNIEKTLNGKRTIQFINKKIVDGKLKQIKFESIENGVIGDLIFTELDKKSKMLNQILIKNPLVKSIEYVDDSKNFKTETIKTDKTQFSIRLQLKSNTKYITISNFAENDPLIKTQIN
ncbi:MAG: hypothetical protein P8K68_03265 [Algibacter sp.]|uniref:hypothetical protein n=1 Tax=Algibacter sp. TaxID=1872428 RepID=UPI0026395575|nr:hypothetical protein [Algibacter sp.]MDG1728752.1 hypothetical protein [Algibacter sp.]MDG2177791.1 hypothetical protein [Algibacter sp.]